MRRLRNIFFCLSILFGLTILPEKGSGQQIDSLLNKIESLYEVLFLRNTDSTYISGTGSDFTLYAISHYRTNRFSLLDRDLESGLRYGPKRKIFAGLGTSYRWFSIDLTFGFNLRRPFATKESRSFDFMARFFTARQYLTTGLHYYRAFIPVEQHGLFPDPLPGLSERPDIRTQNFELQYLYTFNHRRFSIRAPFVMNEIQRKSAGSPVAGVHFSLYNIAADSSLIPVSMSSSIDSVLHLRDMNLINLGINAGYFYSLVLFRHFFITAGLIPGLVLSSGDYKNNSSDYFMLRPNLRLISMNAVGYNNIKIFTGFHFTASGNRFILEKGKLTLYSQGQISFYFGMRF